MSSILGYAFVSIVVCMFLLCALFGFTACMRPSQISRQEEAEGAPEGALDFHFHHPDASGSKLGVRVSNQVQSSGGG